ncbi:MAG TPA: DUF222 domain-containing protein, partial [Geodermatophilus sp.]|nr:DUF222 domain-containing protein [Geodermatophilus sp.]
AAGGLLHEAVLLDERLPATLAALAQRRIGWEHARVLAEQLAPLADDAVRAAVEARLLARIGSKTAQRGHRPRVRAGTAPGTKTIGGHPCGRGGQAREQPGEAPLQQRTTTPVVEHAFDNSRIAAR